MTVDEREAVTSARRSAAQIQCLVEAISISSGVLTDDVVTGALLGVEQLASFLVEQLGAIAAGAAS